MERRLAGSLRARWKQLATTAKDWECRALCASAKASEVYRDHLLKPSTGNMNTQIQSSNDNVQQACRMFGL